jgi:tetratricopeptide (TPR) repeat protein
MLNRRIARTGWLIGLALLASGCVSRSRLVERTAYDHAEPSTLSDYIRGIYRLSTEGVSDAAVTSEEVTPARQIADLEAHVAEQPADRDARSKLIKAYIEQESYDAAYPLLVEDHIENPRDTSTNLNLARIWDAWGAYELALRYANLGIATGVSAAEGHDLAGRIHLHRNAPGDAIASFRAALQMDEGNAAVIANLGFAYTLEANWEQARIHLERAVALDDTMPEPHNNLALVLFQSGDRDGALAHLMKVGRPAAAFNNLGVLYLQVHKVENARRSFEEALRLEPAYETAQRNLQSIGPPSPPPSIVHLPSFGAPQEVRVPDPPVDASRPAVETAAAPAEPEESAAPVPAPAATPVQAPPRPIVASVATPSVPLDTPERTPVEDPKSVNEPAAATTAETILRLEHRGANAMGVAGLLILTGALARRTRRPSKNAIRLRSQRTGEKGAALVEAAIVLPLLVLILVGTVEFGVVLHDYLILQNASREGARFAAVGNPQAAVEQRVRDFAFQLNDASLGVEVENAQGDRGSAVVVRATYPVPLITLLMKTLTSVDNFGLQAESQMRLE